MNYYYPYPQQNVQQNYQQSGFVHVQSETDARNYPVAPGGSVTFIDDRLPYCYTKTMGFSQFDPPTFRKFKLVEETAPEPQNSPSAGDNSAPPSDTFNDLKGEIEALRLRIEALESKNEKVTIRKREEE